MNANDNTQALFEISKNHARFLVEDLSMLWFLICPKGAWVRSKYESH
jgi:hypothetical protein